MQAKKYYIAALTAFILWGFFSLGLKPIKHYPSLDILFYRVFFAILLISLINIIFRKKVIKQNITLFKNLPSVEKKAIIKLTILGGLLLTLNWYLFIYVINHVNIQAGSFAYLICPIVTTILAFIILKEKLNKWQKLSIGISIFACLVLGLNSLKDIGFSLIIALTYALYLISQRKNKVIDSFLSLNLQMLIMFILLVPFYPAYSSSIPTESIFYICLFFIVIFFTVIPLFLNLFALSGISSSTVGIMIYINPIFNFFLAIFYFKEQVSLFQLVGYCIILCSVILFNKEVIFPSKIAKN